ncbi:unnamed protein product [Cyprideis torosa]|uniref:Uncharacterized protein n=1 Tax=Cyprideis torosa TaxID=163714 RepID=A0A7R8W7D1_9CRUS|nr:unnamed protein product [Cyprideis torosa]CAG0887428.1 unnamed protein product [Cyprideis torosa]
MKEVEKPCLVGEIKAAFKEALSFLVQELKLSKINGSSGEEESDHPEEQPNDSELSSVDSTEDASNEDASNSSPVPGDLVVAEWREVDLKPDLPDQAKNKVGDLAPEPASSEGRKLRGLEGRRRQQREKKKWKCVQCSEAFPTRQRLSSHDCPQAVGVELVEDEPEDDDEDDVDDKVQVRRRGGVHTCGTCGKRFKQRFSMRKHAAREHEGGLDKHPEFSKPVTCEVCNRVFPFHRIYQHRKSHRQKSYPCEMCGKELCTPQAMRRHMAVIHNGDQAKRVQCEFCGKDVREIDLRIHVSEYHPKMSLKCLICDKEYSTKSSFRKHQESAHEGGGRFVCATCGKNFVTNQRLRVHERTHSAQKPHVCETCGAGFANPLTLKSHVAREHEGGYENDPELSRPVSCEVCGKVMPFYRIYHHRKNHKKYPCKVCGIELSCPQSVRKHTALIHNQGETDRVECEVCGKILLAFRLKTHMSQYHTDAASLKCSLCSKEFKTKANLASHKRYTHVEEAKHVCSICGKKWATISKLRIHEDSHSDVKRHICGNCGKAFKYSAQLSLHVRVDHEGQVPFKCKECGKVYRTRQRLNDHMNLHLGIKPCVCSICGETFATSSSLDSHRKKHRFSQAGDLSA